MTVRRRTLVLTALVFVASFAVAVAIGTLITAATSGQREADRARDQAQAQASIVADQRAAQSRRIDLLRAEVDELHETARQQAALIGQQEQAIRDLSTQVAHGGQRPVTTAVAPKRDTTRTPAPTSGTRPTTRSSARTTQPTTAPEPQPRPPAAERPAPATSSSPGLVCGLLPIIC